MREKGARLTFAYSSSGRGNGVWIISSASPTGHPLPIDALRSVPVKSPTRTRTSWREVRHPSDAAPSLSILSSERTVHDPESCDPFSELDRVFWGPESRVRRPVRRKRTVKGMVRPDVVLGNVGACDPVEATADGKADRDAKLGPASEQTVSG